MTDVKNPDSSKEGISYAFEHVAAKLVPFDLSEIADAVAPGGITQAQTRSNVDNRNNFINSELWTAGTGKTKDSATPLGPVKSRNLQGVFRKENHVLAPIVETLGLVFPYNPSISEKVSVKYSSIDLTHANENYHSYQSTENVRINISNAKWTCDTFEHAVYALAALHFFRSYSYMDFGQPGISERRPTGRPPAPMWFSAYGEYGFNRVPCLYEGADWSWPDDVDYIGIPQPGTEEWINRKIKTKKNVSGDDRYTWMPVIFEVSSISLIVQHSPLYWITWNLDDFRSGRMLERGGRGGFHRLPKTVGNT